MTLKKGHPCGSRRLGRYLRVGADFKTEDVIGCGHQIMVPRKWWEKNNEKI